MKRKLGNAVGVLSIAGAVAVAGLGLSTTAQADTLVVTPPPSYQIETKTRSHTKSTTRSTTESTTRSNSVTTVRPLGNSNSGHSRNYNYGNHSGLVNSILNGLNNSQPTYNTRQDRPRTVHRAPPPQPHSSGPRMIDNYFRNHGLDAN